MRCSEGLTEVKNPSEFMLSGRPEGTAGSVVACAMEGTRPLMLEVQALSVRRIFRFRGVQLLVRTITE